MDNNPNKDLIRSLIFVGLVLAFLVLKFHNFSARNKSLGTHPAWAVGFFDGIQGGGPRQSPHASYLFHVNSAVYEARIDPKKINYLGAKVWTTCFPILYSTEDTSICEVIVDPADLNKFSVEEPNSVEDSVKHAEHPLQLAARPYPYNTELRKGFYLQYDFNDSHEYLSLRGPGGDTIKKVLVGAERGTPFRNLGYPIADFTDYFVLAHDYDSGQPPHIQLFEKSTGANLLEPGAVWIGADTVREELVYRVEGGGPGAPQNIILCPADTSRKQSFPYPKNAQKNSLQLTSITSNILTLTYQDSKGASKKISYSR